MSLVMFDLLACPFVSAGAVALAAGVVLHGFPSGPWTATGLPSASCLWSLLPGRPQGRRAVPRLRVSGAQ